MPEREDTHRPRHRGGWGGLETEPFLAPLFVLWWVLAGMLAVCARMVASVLTRKKEKPQRPDSPAGSGADAAEEGGSAER